MSLPLHFALVISHIAISGAQYTANTACSQLNLGTCRPACLSFEIQQFNEFTNLCNGEVCCGQRQGTGQGTGTWLTWSAWSTCSVSRGRGLRRRIRSCREGTCLGTSAQSQACEQSPCQSVVTPTFGPWTEWSICSSSCGNGQVFRFRQCSGQQCSGPSFEINGCNNGLCSTTTTSTTTVTPTTSTRSTTNGSSTNSNATSSTTALPITTLRTSTSTKMSLNKRNCLPLEGRAVGTSNVESCRDNPWTVHFDLYRNFRNATFDGNLQIPFCNGVLLSNTTVLTTRTCSVAIEAVSTDGIYVVAFANLYPNGTQKRNISNTRAATSTGAVARNLAIVTVSAPYNLDACAVPACLPDATDEFSRGANCRITGWEPQTEPTNELIVTSVQREADASFVPNSNCQDIYNFTSESSNVTVYSDTVCGLPVSRTGAATCEADNGWMLVCEDSAKIPTLVGLSATSPCIPTHPSTFQGIQAHMNWINSVLNELK